MNAMPHDVALHLLDYLDAISLSKCAETHNVWRKLAASDHLWQRRCQDEFGFDGGKADYASRWRQERLRSSANLKLYVSFLDEIFNALGTAVTIAVLFAAFPLLVVLKLDGWLAMSWTRVFASVYGIALLPVMFILVRLALLFTILSPVSTLHSCIRYGGLPSVLRATLINAQVATKMVSLSAASMAVIALPFFAHLYADSYLTSLTLPALVLLSAAVLCVNRAQATRSSRQPLKTPAFASGALSCSLLFVKASLFGGIPWCVVIAPLVSPVWHASRRQGSRLLIVLIRHIQTGSARAALTIMSSYYGNGNLPLFSLTLLALRLDNVVAFPWLVVSLDYAAWVLLGPVAHKTRHLVYIMLREMPIPGELLKL